MMNLEDLETRVEELEQRAKRQRSLPLTMLVVVFGLLGVVLVQYKINMHFKGELESINRVEAEASHEM